MRTINLNAIRFSVRTAHPTHYETRNTFAAFASSRLRVFAMIILLPGRVGCNSETYCTDRIRLITASA
jgi:hypothetical protein